MSAYIFETVDIISTTSILGRCTAGYPHKNYPLFGHFRANWFKFGMQVQNYILKDSEYRKRGECERNATCRVEYSIDISGRKCGPIEITLKRVSFCVCDDYKPNSVIMKEEEHHTCQFGMFTNQQCNISGISAGKTAGHGA